MFLSFHPNGPETSLTSTSQLLSSIKYLEFNTHIFNSCDFMPISPIFNSISGYLLTQYKLRSKNIYQRGSLSFLGLPAACVTVTSTKTDTGAGWCDHDQRDLSGDERVSITAVRPSPALSLSPPPPSRTQAARNNLPPTACSGCPVRRQLNISSDSNVNTS